MLECNMWLQGSNVIFSTFISFNASLEISGEGWSKLHTCTVATGWIPPTAKPLKFLSTQGLWRCPGFSPSSSRAERGRQAGRQAGRLCLFVFRLQPLLPVALWCQPAHRPPRQTGGTQACCHSVQAPQRLRFPLGLSQVFAVSHIVGIQHQPVYWSPCGFSPPPTHPLIHPLLPLLLLCSSSFFSYFQNTPSLHHIHSINMKSWHTPLSSCEESLFLPCLCQTWLKSHW